MEEDGRKFKWRKFYWVRVELCLFFGFFIAQGVLRKTRGIQKVSEEETQTLLHLHTLYSSQYIFSALKSFDTRSASFIHQIRFIFSPTFNSTSNVKNGQGYKTIWLVSLNDCNTNSCDRCSRDPTNCHGQ